MTLRTAALAGIAIALIVAACGGDASRIQELEATVAAITGDAALSDDASPDTADSSDGDAAEPQVNDATGPEDVVREFYSRLVRFDTAGMVELYCPELREDAEAGVGMLQSAIGFGGLFGISIDKLELADFQAEMMSGDDTVAVVRVLGRLLAGAPLGSTPIDDVVTLRRANRVWCLSSDESVRREGQEVNSNRCLVSIGGYDVADLKPGDTLQLHLDETTTVGSLSPVGFRSHMVQLEFGSQRWTVSEEDDDGSPLWVESINVGDYAGTGLYKVVVVSLMSDGSTCVYDAMIAVRDF